MKEVKRAAMAREAARAQKGGAFREGHADSGGA